MATVLTAEELPHLSATPVNEPPQTEGKREPHPLSREAQEDSFDWFAISFMALFHAGAILAFFFFTWSAPQLPPRFGSSPSALGLAWAITAC